jgi:hypothetical protein
MSRFTSHALAAFASYALASFSSSPALAQLPPRHLHLQELVPIPGEEDFHDPTGPFGEHPKL